MPEMLPESCKNKNCPMRFVDNNEIDWCKDLENKHENCPFNIKEINPNIQKLLDNKTLKMSDLT